MSKAEEYIEGFTKDGDTEYGFVTKEIALNAVEIAKEEVAKKVLELLQGDQTIAIINVIMYCNSIIGKEE